MHIKMKSWDALALIAGTWHLLRQPFDSLNSEMRGIKSQRLHYSVGGRGEQGEWVGLVGASGLQDGAEMEVQRAE